MPARRLELAALLLELVEQARVLDGERGLRGERLEQLDRIVGEGPARLRRTISAPITSSSRSSGTPSSARMPGLEHRRMQRIGGLRGQIRDLNGVPLRDALADTVSPRRTGRARIARTSSSSMPWVAAIRKRARLGPRHVDGAAAGIGEGAGMRQDAREHGLELERGVDRAADLAERLQLAHRARQLPRPLLDLALEVGVGLLQLPRHLIEVLGERLQLVAGLDVDAASKIAPADPSRSLLQGPDRARQTAHVPPGESHEQQQGQAADGDTGDDRPVVDLALPVDRSLQLLTQLDREAFNASAGPPELCR